MSDSNDPTYRSGLKRIRGASDCTKYSYPSEDDNEREQSWEENLAAQVFSIPMILKQILEYLPKEQLLQTALVNKNWNFFSREVLRSEESSLAKLVFRLPRSIDSKLMEIQQTVNIPFNGIILDWIDPDPDEEECIEIGRKVREFLPKMTLKYLSITKLGCEFNSRDQHLGTCFLREILRNRTESVEGIDISELRNRMTSVAQFFGFEDGKLKFPSLKFLRLQSPYSDQSFQRNFYEFQAIHPNLVQELVQISPNIQKIYGTFPTRCLESLLPLELPNILEDFVFQPLVDPLDSILKYAFRGPELKRLAFSCRPIGGIVALHHLSEPEVGKIAQIMRLLLSSSQDSLNTLSANNFDLIIMAHKWNIPPMKAVTELYLNEVISPNDDGIGISILRKLEWEKYFPHLSTVFVTDEYLSILDFQPPFYIDGAIAEMKVQYSCRTVSKVVIELYLRPLVAYDANDLANFLFPCVKSLQIHYHYEPYDDDINHLNFNLWRDLESLVLKFKFCISGKFNMDDYFLGVGREEAKYIFEYIHDELESLELVRNYTGLLDFPGLKKVEIYLMQFQGADDVRRDWFFMTHLIPCCVLSRLPELQLEIYPSLNFQRSASELPYPLLENLLTLSPQITVKGNNTTVQNIQDAENMVGDSVEADQI